VGYEAGMCLPVSRCGPRKSMRVIFGDPECSGSGVELREAAAIVRVVKRGWAGLCRARQGIGYRCCCDYLLTVYDICL
jgi:hypothetical protein